MRSFTKAAVLGFSLLMPIIAQCQATVVYVTASGTKYHRADCRSLARSKIEMKLDEAVSKGYTPCAVCKPEDSRQQRPAVAPAGDLEPRTWFVLLVTGKTPPPEDRDQVAAMQMAHIDNFKRRHAEGKLLAAGPLNDPGRTRRGIVVLKAQSPDEVRKCFEGDPFVENGILEVVAFPWAMQGRFGSEIDETKMAEYRLVVFRTANPEEPPSARELSEAMSLLRAPVYGAVSGGGLVGIAMVKGVDDDALKAALEGRSSRIAYEIIPLWMSEGVLGQARDASSLGAGLAY